jgi:simple sugar transport system ATP-binding protein
LVKELSVSDLAQMMLGEQREQRQIQKTASVAAKPVLQVKNLSADNDKGLEAVVDCTFTVHTGEIVGIAGVSGNGQRELMEVLMGQRSPTSGQILVHGETYQATRAQMERHQIFSLPEEPLCNACVSHMSVAENLALRTFDHSPQAKWGWLLILKAIRQAAQTLIGSFAIKTPSLETPIGHLSGGNVQRCVLARELSSPNIQVLIAANPCFGLDFAAVEYIQSQIVEARNRGVAVLLVSEDLDELLALADSILVLSAGRIVYESAIASADFVTIGQRMAGH